MRIDDPGPISRRRVPLERATSKRNASQSRGPASSRTAPAKACQATGETHHVDLVLRGRGEVGVQVAAPPRVVMVVMG